MKDKSITTAKQKMFLPLLGLIMLPLLFEACLRIGSLIYYRLGTNYSGRTVPSNEGNNKIKILCLGDSFCFGLGTFFNNSFPSQLEKLLNRNYGERFIVYNKGKDAFNTFSKSEMDMLIMDKFVLTKKWE